MKHTRNPKLRLVGCLAPALLLLAGLGHASELNLATSTCAKYENDVVNASAAGPHYDAIDTVMWLFGFAVAKSGAHVMYGDALAAFGFALDGECKSNPGSTLLDALSVVKPASSNPMDLATLPCATFATRNIDMQHSDPESATTIMMWLFGYAVGYSGGHILDDGALPAFQTALAAQCTQHPQASLFDALTAVKTSR
jgi:hypothetical protein